MTNETNEGDVKDTPLNLDEKSNLEYRGLAEYIGFSKCQKRIVSCSITFIIPLLGVGGFLFLLSFLITSLCNG